MSNPRPLEYHSRPSRTRGAGGPDRLADEGARIAMDVAAAPASAPRATLERVLDWVGGDDPATLASKVLAFRRYMLVHLAAESWFRYSVAYPRHAADLGLALLFTLCMGFGVFRRFNRPAVELLVPVTIAMAVWWFPETPDHLYLAVIVTLMLALFDPENDAENSLLMKGLRWLPALALFWSGLKKLAYGYYFDATIFGQLIGDNPRFREFFRLLLSPEEHLRLVRLYWPRRLGPSPYAVNSPLIVALSNAEWILEIVLPVALFFRKLRRAAFVTIVFVLTIDFAARDVFFGAMFSSLMLLYSPRDLNRRLFPLFLAFFVWMLLAGFSVVPRWGLW